jgi:2-methylcitrate dehydratase PrpD
MVAEPVAAKRRPRTPYDGKFSLPFVLGAMLVHGRVDVATFAPAVIADEAVARVAARVETTAVPTASVPNPFGGRVVVELLDGTRLEAAVDHPRGSAAAPMSAAAIRAKFRANAALLLDDAMVSLHEERLLGLAAAPSARISPW